jgi:hypothetical protein
MTDPAAVKASAVDRQLGYEPFDHDLSALHMFSPSLPNRTLRYR